jgi:hypothetical protein
MIKVRRRNWTSQARRFSKADAFVVSIPKSGRTWLRVFLYSYFCRSINREFTISNRKLVGSGVPKVEFTHDLWSHVVFLKWKYRLLGKGLIPRRESRSKPILLLVRDPRDVIVSFFFQITRRAGSYPGDLRDAIRNPRFGIPVMVDVMNAWLAEWRGREDFKIVRYEDCRSDTEATFREVLAFFGVKEIDEAAFRHGMQFSSFENMKQMESSGRFKNKILSPGNVKDPESFKTRRGVVGGFNDYLGPEDIRYMNEALTRLDARFGYTQETAAKVAAQNG